MSTELVPMSDELYSELLAIFASCRGRESEMTERDQTFFTSLSNKFAAHDNGIELSGEQIERLRGIRTHLYGEV